MSFFFFVWNGYFIKTTKKQTTANIQHSQQSSERQTHSEPFTTTIPNISEEHYVPLIIYISSYPFTLQKQEHKA